ncbi:hypothetical protein Q8W71_00065 [Methylobacterium sp. NEAU 140]|nr:hypothetical protein [Methylobacterium sp. NEAU 140]MDP4021005.1 hypothetical protein [Methylobacterium sp. NEAU 140]
MPRWLFVLFCAALALSVLGSVLIVLRSPGSLPEATRRERAP